MLDLWGAAVTVAVFLGLARLVVRRADLRDVWQNRALSVARLALMIVVASWAIEGVPWPRDVATTWTARMVWLLWAPAFVGYFFAYWMALSGPTRPDRT